MQKNNAVAKFQHPGIAPVGKMHPVDVNICAAAGSHQQHPVVVGVFVVKGRHEVAGDVHAAGRAVRPEHLHQVRAWCQLHLEHAALARGNVELPFQGHATSERWWPRFVYVSDVVDKHILFWDIVEVANVDDATAVIVGLGVENHCAVVASHGEQHSWTTWGLGVKDDADCGEGDQTIVHWNRNVLHIREDVSSLGEQVEEVQRVGAVAGQEQETLHRSGDEKAIVVLDGWQLDIWSM